MDKRECISKINSFLVNRRKVFFDVYPNSYKQQLIINAENMLPLLRSSHPDKFKGMVSKYADDFILPLLPSETSPFNATFTQLYTQLKSI
jgi:hypothetical protein